MYDIRSISGESLVNLKYVVGASWTPAKLLILMTGCPTLFEVRDVPVEEWLRFRQALETSVMAKLDGGIIDMP